MSVRIQVGDNQHKPVSAVATRDMTEPSAAAAAANLDLHLLRDLVFRDRA